MIVVYTPEGGEPEQYDASTLRVSEASIVQRTIDKTWQQVLSGLEEDDLDAMRGIVWVIKKRSQPSLRWGDFDPGVTEMTALMSNKEIQRYVESSFELGDTNEEMTRETVAGILRSRIGNVAVDPEYALALIDKLAAEEDPKEERAAEAVPGGEFASSPNPTSSTPETPTSDSSPTSATSHQLESMT